MAKQSKQDQLDELRMILASSRDNETFLRLQAKLDNSTIEALRGQLSAAMAAQAAAAKEVEYLRILSNGQSIFTFYLDGAPVSSWTTQLPPDEKPDQPEPERSWFAGVREYFRDIWN